MNNMEMLEQFEKEGKIEVRTVMRAIKVKCVHDNEFCNYKWSKHVIIVNHVDGTESGIYFCGPHWFNYILSKEEIEE